MEQTCAVRLAQVGFPKKHCLLLRDATKFLADAERTCVDSRVFLQTLVLITSLRDTIL